MPKDFAIIATALIAINAKIPLFVLIILNTAKQISKTGTKYNHVPYPKIHFIIFKISKQSLSANMCKK